MRRTRRAGIAKFVLGEREYLVAVKSTEGALSLVTLHYSAEILSAEEIAPSKGTIDPEEKSRIQKAIAKMAVDFDPDKYADERRKKILKLLKKKEKEQALVEAPQIDEEAGEGPVDLIAALEESMRKVKGIR
jgi:DNA end-binding protein Ku